MVHRRTASVQNIKFHGKPRKCDFRQNSKKIGMPWNWVGTPLVVAYPFLEHFQLGLNYSYPFYKKGPKTVDFGDSSKQILRV